MRIKITAKNGKLVVFDVDAQMFVVNMLLSHALTLPVKIAERKRVHTYTLSVEIDDGSSFSQKVRL
jgi:hypothetical protein